MSVLLLFIDGVGLAAEDDANPLARAQLPQMRALLGGAGPFVEHAGQRGERATLVALDATMGVAGLPQSGTGQVALLTGSNAARAFGRHFGPWVPTPLRPLLARESVLQRARDAGLRVAFANAYPEEVLEQLRAAGGAVRGATPLRAAPPFAALASGLLNRHTAELARGDAVASELVNDGWITRLGRAELPVITAAEAGRNLARIAAAHDLTLFAHYSTDAVGHRGTMAQAVAAIERVDEFIGGVVAASDDGVQIVVASDHGNLERHGTGHTRNPALGLVIGAEHADLAARLASITDVAPGLLAGLGVEPATTASSHRGMGE